MGARPGVARSDARPREGGGRSGDKAKKRAEATQRVAVASEESEPSNLESTVECRVEAAPDGNGVFAEMEFSSPARLGIHV
jgi:hypothetical protein